MRVIGKDKDFYDVCMSWDEDRSILYNRTTTQVHTPLGDGGQPKSLDELCVPSIAYVDQRPNDREYWTRGSGVLVGWCGRVIPAVRLSLWPDYRPVGYEGKSNVFYSVDQVVKAAQTMSTADPAYYKSYIARGQWWLSAEAEKHLAALKEWLELGRVDESHYAKDNLKPIGDWRTDKRFTGLFSKHNVPIWIFEAGGYFRGVLTLNPILTKYGFQTFMDTNTAWWELREYVGGVMVQPAGVEPRPISDEIKRDLAGFDSQSFKRGPTKAEKSAKRRKKKENK